MQNTTISFESLNELYSNQKLTGEQIAKSFSVSPRTIFNNLIKFNIPRRDKGYHTREKLKNFIGRRFGKLTILSDAGYTKTKHKKALFLCQCDCGKEKVVKLNSLQTNTNSCGCSQYSRYEGINGACFGSAKLGAKKRGLSFNITIQDAWKQFQKQNGICALSGEKLSLTLDSKKYKIQTASLDRIDSSKGYEINNIQWVHKKLNVMKMAMDEKEFFSWIAKIYDFRVKK